MKTLKKTLCLVLAVIMALGVMVLPAAAADDNTYTDADKIKPEYRQAVDVLDALEVLEGLGDGTFSPEGKLRRAEGAMIAVRLLLKPDGADKLGTSATEYTDVPDNYWASGVIGYATTKGVIDGNGDGTFSPEKLLTRNEFAKMLLIAMGINDNYTGTYWAVTVYARGRDAGLFEGVEDVDGNAVLTREQAAQMTLNAIVKERQVTVWDEEKKVWAVPDGGISGDPLIEVVFGLDKKETEDVYGRPATEWSLDGEALVVSTKKAIAEYSVPVTGKQIYKDFGLKANYTDTVNYTVDGADQTGIVANATSNKITSTSTDTFGGYGALTQLYKIAQYNTTTGAFIGYKYTVTVILPHASTVSASGFTRDSEGNRVPYIRLVDGTVITDSAWVDTLKDTLLLYTVGFEDGETVVASISAPEGFTARLDIAKRSTTVANGKWDVTYTGKDGSVTTKSSWAADNGKAADKLLDNNANLADSIGKENTLYLDDYGYVLKIDDAAPAEAGSLDYIKVLATSNPVPTYNYITNQVEYVGKVYGIVMVEGKPEAKEFDINYTLLQNMADSGKYNDVKDFIATDFMTYKGTERVDATNDGNSWNGTLGLWPAVQATTTSGAKTYSGIYSYEVSGGYLIPGEAEVLVPNQKQTVKGLDGDYSIIPNMAGVNGTDYPVTGVTQDKVNAVLNEETVFIFYTVVADATSGNKTYKVGTFKVGNGNSGYIETTSSNYSTPDITEPFVVYESEGNHDVAKYVFVQQEYFDGNETEETHTYVYLNTEGKEVKAPNDHYFEYVGVDNEGNTITVRTKKNAAKVAEEGLYEFTVDENGQNILVNSTAKLTTNVIEGGIDVYRNVIVVYNNSKESAYTIDDDTISYVAENVGDLESGQYIIAITDSKYTTVKEIWVLRDGYEMGGYFNLPTDKVTVGSAEVVVDQTVQVIGNIYTVDGYVKNSAAITAFNSLFGSTAGIDGYIVFTVNLPAGTTKVTTTDHDGTALTYTSGFNSDGTMDVVFACYGDLAVRTFKFYNSANVELGSATIMIDSTEAE